ncbi:MAG: hypothetical protein GY757_36535 [bacterium]|nr:hypothetical protein [bacterium]
MAIYILNLYPSEAINGAEILKWRGDNTPNPLKIGDTVIVIAHFGTYTKGGKAITMAEYYGLSLGACYKDDATTMKASLDNKGYLGILKNITESATAGDNDFFINAKKYKEDITRDNNTANLTYMIQMEFNPGTTRKTEIGKMKDKVIDIVADYGDPHENYTSITVDVT